MEEPVTVERFFKIATGWIGLKPREFWEMRVKDFLLMLDGYYDSKKIEFRGNVELVRAQTTHLINIQLESDKRMKPEELWPLEWDEKSKQTQEEENMTEEEIREHNRKLAGMI